MPLQAGILSWQDAWAGWVKPEAYTMLGLNGTAVKVK
jgi:hypothetical protein